MLGVLLTSVLSNDQPFSCACERVAVTLTGDALSSQSGRAGLYTLMQDVTSLDRPVYRRADCDGDEEYTFTPWWTASTAMNIGSLGPTTQATWVEFRAA